MGVSGTGSGDRYLIYILHACWYVSYFNIGQPPLDQSDGFLPPNNGTTGQGYVSFTIKAYNQSGGLVQINSSAQITFDQSEPYDTQPFINTVRQRSFLESGMYI